MAPTSLTTTDFWSSLVLWTAYLARGTIRADKQREMMMNCDICGCSFFRERPGCTCTTCEVTDELSSNQKWRQIVVLIIAIAVLFATLAGLATFCLKYRRCADAGTGEPRIVRVDADGIDPFQKTFPLNTPIFEAKIAACTTDGAARKVALSLAFNDDFRLDAQTAKECDTRSGLVTYRLRAGQFRGWYRRMYVYEALVDGEKLFVATEWRHEEYGYAI